MPDIYDATQKRVPVIKRKPSEYSEVMKQFSPSKSTLGAFLVRPKSVRMGIQQAEEKILLLMRRHIVTNIGWVLGGAIMFVAPLLINMIPFPQFIPERFAAATIVLWYLLTFAVFLEGFLSWYYNVFIITDERIIDVDFKNLIYKNVSAAKIDNIEDVTVQMGGAIRNVLNFGTVLIQTAGERVQFEFEDVPNPQEVSKLLNELILEEEQEKLEGRAR